ncbi:protein DA1-related 1-like [Carex rostrata]
MHDPRKGHMDVVYHILKYLKSASGKGLIFRQNEHMNIEGYCDSDWASCQDVRRSTTGYCMFVGGNLVSWKSKKQPVVSKSMAEAEYRVMALGVAGMLWLKRLLEELNHDKTKHMEIDRFFIKEKLESELLELSNVAIGDQVVDCLTKGLSSMDLVRICAGCKTSIGTGRFLSCMDSVWHPDCFCCDACDKPISDFEFSMHGDHPYHKNCYRELYCPKCEVCKDFIPTNKNGFIEYRAHTFWMQKYCPSHEDDDTPRCCSCERLEPKDVKYITLDDERKLCLECLNSAIIDNSECQTLYIDIQGFYEGLNMEVEQQVPLLLVERQALNEAIKGEKMGHHHLPKTRGLCLSEEQIVRTILRRPVIGPGNKIIDMVTGNHRLVRRCEVTAILILFGLPRLLTGSILAHEMMHAWLRLKGFRSLNPEVEEGICQVLAHMWLESEITSGSSSTTITHTESTSASASASASALTSSSSTSSKKGPKSDFEKKLGEFFKNKIETDTFAAYGEGFRVGNKAVTKYGLRTTLEHIKFSGSFPY